MNRTGSRLAGPPLDRSSPLAASAPPAPREPAPAGGSDPVTAVTAAALAATLGMLVAGLVLAMAGIHHAWLQGPLGIAIAAALFRHLPRRSTIEWPRLAQVAVLLLVTVVTVLNLATRSELVLTGRDGATYANTASFLVDEGGLFPAAIEDPFRGDEFEFEAPGFVPRADGTFWQQFLHATPALYAFFGEVFGKSAIFAVNALLAGVGVLAMLLLASRFLSPWWAVAAAAITAASLPYAYYARGTFSEMAALVLSIGGLWVGHVALTSAPRYAVPAGLLLGGAALVRVDAWMMGVAIGLLLLSTVWMREGAAAAVAKRFFLGFAVTGSLGLLDLVFFAEPYLAIVGKVLLPLILAAIGLRALAPVAGGAPLQRLAEAAQRHARPVEVTVTLIAVGVIAFLWFGRSLLPHQTAPGVYGLDVIQLREGLPLEPTRVYTELSVWWLTWYVGIPLTALGAVGVIEAIRRTLRPGTAAMRLMVLAFLVPAVTYLVRPSVNPDHIWAIRRFLPVVIPGLVIFGLAAFRALADRLQPVRYSSPVVTVAALAIVAPVLMSSTPLILTADRAGLGGQMGDLCELLGDSRSVLIIDDDPEVPLWWRLGPPLRSWCQVSVAGVAAGTPIIVRPDAIIASQPELLPTTPEDGFEFAATAWLSRLTGPPDATEVGRLRIWVDRNCCEG